MLFSFIKKVTTACVIIFGLLTFGTFVLELGRISVLKDLYAALEEIEDFEKGKPIKTPSSEIIDTLRIARSDITVRNGEFIPDSKVIRQDLDAYANSSLNFKFDFFLLFFLLSIILRIYLGIKEKRVLT